MQNIIQQLADEKARSDQANEGMKGQQIGINRDRADTYREGTEGGLNLRQGELERRTAADEARDATTNRSLDLREDWNNQRAEYEKRVLDLRQNRLPLCRNCFVRSRTVAKVDSIGFVVRMCRQCSAGKS